MSKADQRKRPLYKIVVQDLCTRSPENISWHVLRLATLRYLHLHFYIELNAMLHDLHLQFYMKLMARC